MTVHEIARLPQLETVQLEEDRTADRVFCCDMLSIAMARAPEDSIWVTVMGNKNVIAVASLTDVACIVIAEGYDFDQDAVDAAKGKVTLLKSSQPVFETASLIHEKLR
ncbi:MAG: hypothetical protein PUK54_10905 [Firmicutes bacterium]|nr:hypothetical protein [Bacillota bacterium]MDD7603080.1 hypothetical protein [Bacillota bacterium]MDY5856392.1 hypothetical protein [Anaerovoracaceae bacterium]